MFERAKISSSAIDSQVQLLIICVQSNRIIVYSFSIEGMKHSKVTEVSDLIEEVLAKVTKQFVASASLQIYDTFVYSG